MPGILNRYILRETAQAWFVVTLVLLLILVTNQFAQVLGDAAASKLPKQAIMLVMGLTSLQYLTILIPVAFFLAIMIALGRLYRDSEMAAIMACGIGPTGLYRPLALFALLLSCVGWLARARRVAPGRARGRNHRRQGQAAGRYRDAGSRPLHRGRRRKRRDLRRDRQRRRRAGRRLRAAPHGGRHRGHRRARGLAERIGAGRCAGSALCQWCALRGRARRAALSHRGI